MAERGAIVLAGGKSERMGQDKALLSFRGHTLLEGVLLTLRPLVGEIVVVTASPNRYELHEVREVTDLFPDCGPVGGIITGLRELGEGQHLVVACDMPLLQTPVLRVLLDAASAEWDAVIPEIGGRLEPLCAVYSASALSPLKNFFTSGQRAAHKALQTLRVRKLEEEVLRRLDPQLITFTNINTPQDLAALESRMI
ncbi:MAG TPA: molybdenum cofactor guanylyltransferase [Chthonomonadaceae bacterium]|nr:molybdenum cofactor guanylyltransferase [Chthonomonadaceae bacterium]